jgi:pimeloyl-ACP methyl ester carboxylesterase
MYERLAATGIPVFFVVGEHDMICPADMIRLCHGLVPNSRYHLVRDSGHSAYWEKPHEFNEVVLGFLQNAEANLTPPD